MFSEVTLVLYVCVVNGFYGLVTLKETEISVFERGPN